MRISFTALTGQGPRDVVIDVDSEVTVGGVARSLFAALDGDPSPNGRSGPLKPRFTKAALPKSMAAGGAGTATRLGTDGGSGHPGPAPGPGGERHALWMDGRMLDPHARAVRELRDGAVVAVERRAAAATVLAEPAGLVEVRVVAGPAAGSVHRLGLGVSTLGSGDDVDVAIGDPAVPARSLRLTVGRDTVQVEASARTAGGALLDGEPLTGPVTWPAGGMLAVGSTILTLVPSAAPDTHLEPLPEGGLAFNRRPAQPRRAQAPPGGAQAARTQSAGAAAALRRAALLGLRPGDGVRAGAVVVGAVRARLAGDDGR